ncbi:MAG: hypothetical protein AAF411_15250 [Myxococcota bacterium]
MALASLLLGIGAFVFMVLGFFTTMIPVVGSLFAFGAPILGLAGIVTGGVAMSRSKAETGESSGAAIAGLVTSIVGFLLSLVIALTCGLCNAAMTTSVAAAGSAAQNGGAAVAGGLGGAVQQLANEAGDRIVASSLVTRVHTACATDASGAGAASMIAPAALASLQGSICADVKPESAGLFSRGCGGGTPDCTVRVVTAQHAEADAIGALGLDASQCVTFTTPGEGTVMTMCQATPNDWRIATARNLGRVQ